MQQLLPPPRRSQFELWFYQWLDWSIGAGSWAMEAKPIHGWPGCVDVYILGCDLIIQIDGQHHFESDMHGNGLARQAATDMECNALVWRQRRRMLRLHYEDLGRHGQALCLAVMCHVQQYPTAPLVVLSWMYKSCEWCDGQTHAQVAHQELGGMGAMCYDGIHNSTWLTL
jgi:hypothetical protein